MKAGQIEFAQPPYNIRFIGTGPVACRRHFFPATSSTMRSVYPVMIVDHTDGTTKLWNMPEEVYLKLRAMHNLPAKKSWLTRTMAWLAWPFKWVARKLEYRRKHGRK